MCIRDRPKNEQVPGEHFTEGQMVQVYVVDVLATERGPRVTISRTPVSYTHLVTPTASHLNQASHSGKKRSGQSNPPILFVPPAAAH